MHYRTCLTVLLKIQIFEGIKNCPTLRRRNKIHQKSKQLQFI